MSLNGIKNNFLYLAFFSLFCLSFVSVSLGTLSFTLFDIFILLSLLFLGGQFLCSKRVLWYGIPLVFYFFIAHFTLLALYPLLGFLIGTAPFLDASVVLRWLFAVFIFIFIIYELRTNSRFLTIIFSVLLISGVLNSIYGTLTLIDMMRGLPFTMPHHFLADELSWKVDHHLRVPALFSGPNSLGWYALLVVLISFAAYMQFKNKFYLMVFFLHSYLLILSTARTAILVFGVLILLIFFSHLIRGFYRLTIHKNIFYFFSFLVLVLLVFFYIAQSFSIFRLDGLVRAISVLSGDVAADGSFSKRTELWQHSVDIYMNKFYPFGSWITPTYYTGTIDSGWLSYLVWSGPFMIISSILLFLIGAIYGFKGFFKKKCNFSLSLAMASIGLAIGQVTLSPLHYIPVLILFFLLFCLAYLSQKNRIML